MKTYVINEMFYSPQGEGVRAGIMHVFVRFAGCNMECREEVGPKSPGGFDCDTEFSSGRKMTLDEINEEAFTLMERAGAHALSRIDNRWMLLTGGEPGLQVDKEFCDYMHVKGWQLAIETNGSIRLPRDPDMTVDKGIDSITFYLLDWITVSPKVAEHAIRQLVAHEVKYVRAHGQALPKTNVNAMVHIISPAFDGLTINNDPQLQERNLKWCLQLIAANPKWRISVQQHKLWRVR